MQSAESENRIDPLTSEAIKFEELHSFKRQRLLVDKKKTPE
jgi:hypothetical protein